MPLDSTDVERAVLDLVGRAMGRFSMLRPGDRVAVGVSGGKDSLCLLHALIAYRRRAPFAYDVMAVTVEQGKFKAPIGLERLQSDPDLPFTERALTSNLSSTRDVGVQLWGDVAAASIEAVSAPLSDLTAALTTTNAAVPRKSSALVASMPGRTWE